MKLPANVFSEPLTKTSDSLTMDIFPDTAKTAAVSPIERVLTIKIAFQSLGL